MKFIQKNVHSHRERDRERDRADRATKKGKETMKRTGAMNVRYKDA